MTNHFKIFDLAEQFSIDKNLLEEKYLQLQNQYHPDRNQNFQQLTIEQINQSYQIINDDFLRACHLLQLKNIDILDDEKTIKPDHAVLLEALDLQEQISEMTNKTAIENLQKKLKQTINDLLLDFQQSFQEQQFHNSGQFLIKIKYFKKALENLKLKKSTL
jgi:molecular chaperone HscB